MDTQAIHQHIIRQQMEQQRMIEVEVVAQRADPIARHSAVMPAPK
jgi:hypothetical protein